MIGLYEMKMKMKAGLLCCRRHENEDYARVVAGELLSQACETSVTVFASKVWDRPATGTALSTVRARLLFNTTSWVSALQVCSSLYDDGETGRLMISTMAPAEVPYSHKLGPHPSYIQVAKPFVFEQKIQAQIIATGANPQREDTFRLQGVQWIDDTRRALQLYVSSSHLFMS